MGFKYVAVHWAIDDQGRGGLVVAQAGDEGFRIPMPMRNRGEEPFAFAGATIKPGHFCRCPGFVNEDRRFGSNRCCPARRVIRASVTSSLSCAAACAVYFNADLMAIKEPRDRANANPQTGDHQEPDGTPPVTCPGLQIGARKVNPPALQWQPSGGRCPPPGAKPSRFPVNV